MACSVRESAATGTIGGPENDGNAEPPLIECNRSQQRWERFGLAFDIGGMGADNASGDPGHLGFSREFADSKQSEGRESTGVGRCAVVVRARSESQGFSIAVIYSFMSSNN